MLGEPGDADGRLERQQLLVAQLARPDVDRRLVQPALGEPVADEVLAGRDDARREVVALHAADVGDAELGREVRVLAVRLLDAAPARVARDVEHRGERVPAADREHPPADRRRRSPRPARGRRSPPRRSTAGTTSRRGRARRGASPRGGSPGCRGASPRPGSAGSRCRPRPRRRASRLVAPATRLIWPIPSPRRSRTRAWSSSVSLRNSSNDQTDPSWATFSSSVIRASRSATRCSIGRLASR